MLPEADFIAKRAALRWLVERHPQWTHQELAAALRMSRSWVSKWRKLLRQADPHDVMALHSRSRARHTTSFDREASGGRAEDPGDPRSSA
jgi:hypothetical protein